jgi:hypothetical protein
MPAPLLPAGPVRRVAGPQIGECLVVVGRSGVMQTSAVRRFVSTPSEVVVDTANSVYVLMHLPEEDAAR